MTGVMRPELKEFHDAECPPCLEGFLCNWNELNERRQIDMMSGSQLPLTYSEVDAWNRLTRADITPLGLDVIFIIDREWVKTHNSK